MRVLQVDSDVAFARQLRGEMLRHGGVLCDLEHCLTVEEALERLSEERFDVLVLDPFSQREESLAPCTTLHTAAPDSPIVVLSSVNDTGVAIDAVCAGAHDYLLKDESQAGWLMRRVRYAIERNKFQRRSRRIAAPHVQARAHAMAQQTAQGTVASVSASQSLRFPEPSGQLHQSQSERVVRDQQAKGPIRVLHVEDDPTFARLARRFLTLNNTVEIATNHVTDWTQAREALEHSRYDAVLLDLTLPDRQGIETLKDLLPSSGGSPVLVLSGRDDDGLAIESMQIGAEDFLIKGDVNMRYLGRATLLAMIRKTHRWPAPAVQPSEPPSPTAVAKTSVTINSSPKTGEAVGGAKSADERRQHSRYILTKPIYTIPIRPDFSPADAQTADGFSVDMSAGGIKLELRGIDRLPTKYLLVGVEDQSATMHFATVEARHIVPVPGGLSIGAQFVSAERDLIRRENLEPRFQPATKGFATGLSLDVLAKWCELGIFRPMLVDRVLLCPQCQSVATFRKGCRACGSVRLHSRPLFHHFACAHVGFVGDFEQDGGIVCPKCRTKNLIVGADYEHLSGPFRCLDCEWSDTELDLVGQCLRCELRFPANQAVEEDLVGYHVERLDPMAFISAN